MALGVGLLLGAERERRKAQRGARAAAGLRTFTILALVGAVSFDLLGVVGLTLTTAIAGALAVVSAWTDRNSEDPGFTTEAALVLTVLLGGFAMREPGAAAMVGVAATILLAARTPLHRFVGSVMTEREVTDGLILAGATLIVLPLLPDHAIGAFQAINPREVWLLVILVLTMAAAGHVAVRMVGVRFGLPLAGLLGGFVSSTATIGAMGARARSQQGHTQTAAAAAVLSTVATMAQLVLVVGAVDLPTLRTIAPSLVAGGVAASLFGLVSTLRAVSGKHSPADDDQGAFSLKSAVIFAAMICLVLFLSNASRLRFGEAGLVFTSGVAGLVDAHAPAISAAMLAAGGTITPSEALVPILVGISTNTVAKLALAAGGGRRFFLRVAPGLVLVAAATWLPLLLELRL